MELPELLTVGGAAVLASILVQAIKNLLQLTAAQVDRFGLALAITIGCLVTVPAALYLGADVGAAILAGLLAGAASVGVYKSAGSLPSLQPLYDQAGAEAKALDEAVITVTADDEYDEASR